MAYPGPMCLYGDGFGFILAGGLTRRRRSIYSKGDTTEHEPQPMMEATMPTNITPRDLRTRKPNDFYINITTTDGELIEQIVVYEREVCKSFAWLTAEITEAIQSFIERQTC